MTSAAFLAGEESIEAFMGPKLTVADYRRTPYGPPWYELIDGVLMAEPSPSSDHQTVLLELVTAMNGWQKKNGGGKLFIAPLDVYLSNHDVLQPDILYVCERRRSIVRKDGIHGPPDLVVEVLSPSNARITRTKKCEAYARFGVKEFWQVDGDVPEILVFQFTRHQCLPTLRLRTCDTLSSSLLPGFRLPLMRLFSGGLS